MDLLLSKIEIPNGVDPRRVYKKLKGMMEHLPEFYKIRTKRDLILTKSEEGWILCVEDTHDNVLVYKWLKRSAESICEGIVFLIIDEAQEMVDEHRHEGAASEGQQATHPNQGQPVAVHPSRERRAVHDVHNPTSARDEGDR